MHARDVIDFRQAVQSWASAGKARAANEPATIVKLPRSDTAGSARLDDLTIARPVPHRLTNARTLYRPLGCATSTMRFAASPRQRAAILAPGCLPLRLMQHRWILCYQSEGVNLLGFLSPDLCGLGRSRDDGDENPRCSDGWVYYPDCGRRKLPRRAWCCATACRWKRFQRALASEREGRSSPAIHSGAIGGRDRAVRRRAGCRDAA